MPGMGGTMSYPMKLHRERQARDFTARQMTAALEEPRKADVKAMLTEAVANTGKAWEPVFRHFGFGPLILYPHWFQRHSAAKLDRYARDHGFCCAMTSGPIPPAPESARVKR